MTTFAVASDLHFEFGEIGDNITGDADYLILAGDIISRVIPNSYRWNCIEQFLYHINNRYKKVFVVAGNHEFYGGCWETRLVELDQLYSKFNNFVFLEDQSWSDDNIQVFGSTLWTDCGLDRGVDYERSSLASLAMNDFHLIYHNDGRKITIDDVYDRYKHSVNSLSNFLDNTDADKKTVVISHHLPHCASIAPIYDQSNLNSFFYSDLSELIDKYSIDLWAHGHTHHSFNYIVSGTKVVCNPRGYPVRYVNDEPVFENTDFDKNLIINI